MATVAVQPQEHAVWAPDPQRGYLPVIDPLPRLDASFEPWETTAAGLPKLMLGDHLRETLAALPPFPLDQLHDTAALERAMVILSFLGHAYVWGGAEPAGRIPASITVPWWAVAARLGRPAVLSYASYALHNWRRLDPAAPVALGNIALLQNFLGGLDEEWFVLVHVDIEARAAPGLAALLPAQAAVGRGEAAALRSALETVAPAVEAMCRSMDRMPEGCDPYIYYRRVRPYIHGWKDNPALPDGVVYEGVGTKEGRAVRLRGETGAQSAIVPALDAALGVAHARDPLKAYLEEMRHYMPPAHRGFVERLERGPSIREAVVARRADAGLRSAYNDCVALLGRFRTTHLEYAARYVHRQARHGAGNPTDVGTGGTPFMAYLRKHREETEAHRLA